MPASVLFQYLCFRKHIPAKVTHTPAQPLAHTNTPAHPTTTHQHIPAKMQLAI